MNVRLGQVWTRATAAGLLHSNALRARPQTGVERETGFEPATACLEGRNSTAELLPLTTY